MLRHKQRPIALMLLVATGLAACATEPIIDTGRPGFDPAAYEYHLAECRGFGQQARPGQQAVQGGLLGAAIGGAFGAVGGAFAGRAGTGAAIGASFGGMGGALEGAGTAYDRRDRVVRNCLASRGYTILD